MMLTETLQMKKNSFKKTLTPRELEVLKFMVQGKSNVQIAKILYISPHTAKAHVGHILEKLNVHDRVDAVVIAIKSGIIK